MSFISCEGSALIPAVLPPSGSTLAVGSVIKPPINLVAVASGALLQPIAGYVLPKGVWLISGTLFVDATVGGQTVSGNTGIASAVAPAVGVVFWRSKNATGTDGVSISLSAVISTDGSLTITIPMTYTTSGGATYAVTNTDTFTSTVEFTRIA